MKKRIILILYLLFCIHAFNRCSFFGSGGYKITGDINGLPDSKIYLEKLTDTGFTYIDSTVIQNGKFQFRGKVEEPHSVTLWFIGKTKKLEPLCSSFYLENSRIVLKGNIRNRSRITPVGSYEEEIRKKLVKEASFPSRYYQLQNILYSASLNNQTIPPDSLQKWKQELKDMESIYGKRLYRALRQFSNSYAALHTTLEKLHYLSAAQLRDLMHAFPSRLHSSTYYQSLKEIVQNRPAATIGNKFKDFTLADTLNSKIAISGFKNRLILVDFWASWCSPCRIQIPGLKKIYALREDSNDFEIIGISIDTDRGRWKQALKAEKMPWPNVIIPEKEWARNNYLIKSIPSNFLLDSNRRIIAKNLSVVELEQALLSPPKKQ